MINGIQLRNFKSLDNEVPLILGGFSIFCGSNSSGKSSLIQALLMLSQTLSSRYSQDSMMLNGHLTRLGSFDDIKNHSSSLNEINFNFSVEVRDHRPWLSGLNSIDVELTFGRINKIQSGDDDLHPALLRASVSLSGKDGEEYNEHLEVSPAQDNDSNDGAYFDVRSFISSEEEAISKEFPDYEIVGCTKLGLIPSTLLVDYDHTKKMSSQILAMITGMWSKRSHGRGKPIDESGIKIPKSFFLAVRARISRERGEALRVLKIPEEIEDVLINKYSIMGREHITIEQIKQELLNATFALKEEIISDSFIESDFTTLGTWLQFLNNLDPKSKKALIEFVDKNRADLQDIWYQGVDKERRRDTYALKVFDSAAHYLNYDFSRSIKYLGPLRNEPLAVYPFIGQIDPANVGLKGEFTAAVLHINKYRNISYHSPAVDAEGGFEYKLKRGTLLSACSEWLSYLGVVSDVRTQDKGKLGYELQVKTNPHEKWQDLTHVGVGVSQVLPIVLMSLLSTRDDILVFEQPELHLHPKVQSRLCDFFIAISGFDRQCLVETHSEYLINRLRLRIVQGKQVGLGENTPIYFIEKKEAKSYFRKVVINTYGAISDWPDDFFDQTDREVEAILLEASKKKRADKKNQG